MGLATVVCVWLYAKVWLDMAVEWWTVPSLSQGLLLGPFTAYLAFSRRNSILGVPAHTDGRGLWLCAAGCLMYAVGKLAAEFFVWRMSFVVLLTGIILTFWGRRRLQILALPLVLLATMIPLPSLIYSSLAAPLQLFASDVSTTLVQSLGVTAHRDGNIIYLAGATLGVEEACSGLNSLSALLVAGVLLASSKCSHWTTRTGLFLLTFPISVAVNVLRVAGTAVLADQNEAYAFGFYHSFSGWVVFVLGFVLLWAAAVLLGKFTRAESQTI
jgi:exosortase